jgi:hypothetical protein
MEGKRKMNIFHPLLIDEYPIAFAIALVFFANCTMIIIPHVSR